MSRGAFADQRPPSPSLRSLGPRATAMSLGSVTFKLDHTSCPGCSWDRREQRRLLLGRPLLSYGPFPDPGLGLFRAPCPGSGVALASGSDRSRLGPSRWTESCQEPENRYFGRSPAFTPQELSGWKGLSFFLFSSFLFLRADYLRAAWHLGIFHWRELSLPVPRKESRNIRENGPHFPASLNLGDFFHPRGHL